MAVTQQNTVFSYIASGVSSFDFGFRLLALGDLVVTVNGVKQSTSAYSVTGIGAVNGGTVTFTTAPVAGSLVKLIRQTQAIRSTDYQTGGDFRADVVNPDFDRVYMLNQDFLGGSVEVLNDIRAPAGEFIPALPSAANRANYILSFDSLGNPVAIAPAVGSSTALSILLAGSSGYYQIGGKQPFPGSVLRLLQDKISESISVADLLNSPANGLNDNTADLQSAINFAAASGRRLIGSKLHTYLIKDALTIPSGLEFDLQGATVIDDVRTFRGGDQAGRAKALFYMYGVHDVAIRNFVYQSTVTRATLSNNVPTGIIWIGDNSTTGSGPTYNIQISGITASNCVDYTLFVAIVGNVYNVDVSKIWISGKCSYGVNIEYGQAPTGTTDALAYGQHPYNINVDNFYGSDNPNSVGFLRLAGCYNVKFSNCYGKDVSSFIYTWTGDRSISRVSESVIFENCAHYASSTFMTGAVNYCVQVLCANKDGSTGTALPTYTNYDHLITFNNCQFQNNKTIDSAALRFYGMQGSVVFRGCIFKKSYYGVRAEPSSNPDYMSLFSLTFEECEFVNNSRDVQLSAIQGVLFSHTKFKSPDNNLVPVKITNNSVQNRFVSCYFTGATTASYVVVDAGCPRNEFTQNTFDPGVTIAALDLSSETLGSNNSSTPALCRPDWAYYGVQGHPESLYTDITLVPAAECDASKRRQYIALTGGVSKTISSIINGRIGDEIVFQSASAGASVTFTHAAAVGTLQRILTPGAANLAKTGKLWTVRLKLNETGWLLMDCP